MRGWRKLYEGCRWAEGPAYFPAGRYLVWSDIPNDRMMRYDETSGARQRLPPPGGLFQRQYGGPAGPPRHLRARQRRVTRTEFDGSITVWPTATRASASIRPNDVGGEIRRLDLVHGPGLRHRFGLRGPQAESEIGACNVYRVDPQSGEVRIVADDFVRPNGIAFSPDERRLYMADTGATHQKNGPRTSASSSRGGGKAQRAGKVFATCTAGLFDGLRLDDGGRVWTSAGDGVHCYEPDGTLIGKIAVPEVVANVCFGGPKRNRLYICGTTSLYALMGPATGPRPSDGPKTF
jgi:gluconolactonase